MSKSKTKLNLPIPPEPLGIKLQGQMIALALETDKEAKREWRRLIKKTREEIKKYGPFKKPGYPGAKLKKTTNKAP